MAKVSMKTIEELFGENFFVPSYQRGYRWTKTQVKELLEDLYDFVTSNKNDDDYYCLQPIIVKRSDDNWELVDGQQRLTALWLISALYYCSYKEDVVEELTRKTYKLVYQEKKVFTDLFSTIDELIEDNSFRTLVGELEQYKTRSIDSRNLISSIEFITSFSRNGKTAKNVLGQIFESLNKVKVIWYVLDDAEDSIQNFTNINANKIELTNAELIKAVLLNAIPDQLKMQNRALQWEDIEKGLNDESFWNYMISEGNIKYNTKIDYIFEIFCTNHDLINEDMNKETDRYEIFRAVNNYLVTCDADDVWMEIQDIYDTLKDWYSDYFFYHTIGLLIIADDSSGAEIITRLYNDYSRTNKTEFKNNILKELKDIYFSQKKTTPFEEFDFDIIKEELEEITIQEPNKVRSILLLYNIALLVNANNTYERFPFELYKKGTWDIEHINPQTPKDATDEEEKAWLTSYKAIIEDESLLGKIDNCINSTSHDEFIEIAEEINAMFNIADNDSISNLVLLDSETNRGYKNSCFSEKRKKIIEIERTKNNDEKYVPIGTKWVFLKGYDNATQLKAWTLSDMKDYVEDISLKIFKMLGGEIDE
ncbi:DUF262 domain-containing protein [Butyrivibrio sp. AE3003]|uniref:DUF262 domain-containing protein n=1 Tax=Butyrivibrio sp. AE3003 TaxID=1496721 RepID=UPI00047D34AF|nr:DUF262 domain-containing protein [Butyrivibrio sp. AE3003]